MSGGRASLSIRRRIEDQVHIDSVTKCWIWLGCVNNLGHPQMRVAKRCWLARRFIFTWYGRKIPPRLDLPATCNNDLCVSPHHATPKPRSAQIRRGWLIRKASKRRTINAF